MTKLAILLPGVKGYFLLESENEAPYGMNQERSQASRVTRDGAALYGIGLLVFGKDAALGGSPVRRRTGFRRHVTARGLKMIIPTSQRPTSRILNPNLSQHNCGSQCEGEWLLGVAMGRNTALKASRPLWSISNASLVTKRVSPWRCRRCYSIQSQEEELTRLPDINPKLLAISKTTTPKQVVPPEQLVFGRTFTGKREFMAQRQCLPLLIRARLQTT